jgi:hypothetical protein
MSSWFFTFLILLCYRVECLSFSLPMIPILINKISYSTKHNRGISQFLPTYTWDSMLWRRQFKWRPKMLYVNAAWLKIKIWRMRRPLKLVKGGDGSYSIMYFDVPSPFPSMCFEHPVDFLGLSDSSVYRMMLFSRHENGTALLLCPVCNTMKGIDSIIIVLLLSSVQYKQMDVIHWFTDKQDLWLYKSSWRRVSRCSLRRSPHHRCRLNTVNLTQQSRYPVP